MNIDVCIKVGGAAGQGIQTVGQFIASFCREAGLSVFAINDFESRIRGGHGFFQLRVSDGLIRAALHNVHVLICMDQKTYDLHQHELDPGGVVLVDSEVGISGSNILPLPFAEMGKKAGNESTANTAAAGACLALLGAPSELLDSTITHFFKAKRREIIEMNLEAAKLGYQSVKEHSFKWSFEWLLEKSSMGLIDGSHAVALGALAGDCRFASFYPMSPATDIMEHLTRLSGDFPLVVEQAEGEIAAVNMVVGAAFAGARSLTATSGGGFCLMTEGLGLAGITETPIVIVNAQRPGPATGLPTRTAQGDLLFAINASQDEFPRFVFAPGSPEEAYEVTARAMTLSEQYQVPVIILVDHYLATSLFTLDTELPVPSKVERYIADDSMLEDPADYKRYEITPSGVSPRAIPCAGDALVLVTGNEHREDGHLSEEIPDRNSMVNKRMNKIKGMINEITPPTVHYPDSEFLLVGWGSTKEIITESVGMLRRENVDAGCVHLCDLWPFPSDEVVQLLSGKIFFMVEQNATAQCGQLIKAQTGLTFTEKILKYDGRPFLPIEICDGFKEKCTGQNP